jgi:hypothetical protein
MPGFVRNHPLIAFFLLAFGVAWAILIPNVLASYGLITIPAPVGFLLVMGHGPTIAAVVVSGALAIRALLARLLIWRVGWAWWAITLFLNGAIILGALGLYGLLGNEVPDFPTLGPGLLVEVVLTCVLVALINREEIGWRGVPVCVGVRPHRRQSADRNVFPRVDERLEQHPAVPGHVGVVLLAAGAGASDGRGWRAGLRWHPLDPSRPRRGQSPGCYRGDRRPRPRAERPCNHSKLSTAVGVSRSGRIAPALLTAVLPDRRSSWMCVSAAPR